MKFILAFFVPVVVDRWKRIFLNIGSVDKACLYINTLIRDPADGDPAPTRLLRRSMARWLCLCQVLVLRDASTRVRRRFPTMQSLVDCGFLRQQELSSVDQLRDSFDSLPSGVRIRASQSNNCLYWVPLNWVFAACYRLRLQGAVASDALLNSLLGEVRVFGDALQKLCNYDWVPVPLAYSQVVVFAVRVYFLVTLFTRQSLQPIGATAKHVSKLVWVGGGDGDGLLENLNLYGLFKNSLTPSPRPSLDLPINEKPSLQVSYVPVVTIFELIIYIGWLKVAEGLLNPLGDDDDNFECDFIIDRNVAVCVGWLGGGCYSRLIDRHCFR